MKLGKIEQNFIQFCCISLTFTFAFDDFKSLVQNFSFTWTGSKLGNFGFDNGENLKI